jgi:threonine synthase
LRYVSTRGLAPKLDFENVLLAGLADDGGLYVPSTWPRLGKSALRQMSGKSYADAAGIILKPFVGSAIPQAALSRMIADSYAGFRHQAVAPLRQIDENLWLMELFHGPTLAFKDVALQLVGRLYDFVLARRSERITVIGATSGDTGSAALEACRDRAAIDIFILHPKGRVSEVQRRQMTTIQSSNVFNIAIDGSFDDCQDLVKAMFADASFRGRINMAAVNSINWARIMAQIVYYATGALALGAPARSVNFAVPSGNFGNVYAGYAARRMGLPVRKLIVGSNRNDILMRFFAKGILRASEVFPTLSPSMDIQVPSNLERLLFDLFQRNGKKLGAAMAAFRETGKFAAPKKNWSGITRQFQAFRFDDAETLELMGAVYRRTGMLVDPHTAIGIGSAWAARKKERGRAGSEPTIALATADAAKFPDAVEQATGTRPRLPAYLADLMERKERFSVLPRDLSRVKDFVLANARLGHNR